MSSTMEWDGLGDMAGECGWGCAAPPPGPPCCPCPCPCPCISLNESLLFSLLILSKEGFLLMKLRNDLDDRRKGGCPCPCPWSPSSWCANGFLPRIGIGGCSCSCALVLLPSCPLALLPLRPAPDPGAVYIYLQCSGQCANLACKTRGTAPRHRTHTPHPHHTARPDPGATRPEKYNALHCTAPHTAHRPAQCTQPRSVPHRTVRCALWLYGSMAIVRCALRCALRCAPHHCAAYTASPCGLCPVPRGHTVPQSQSA